MHIIYKHTPLICTTCA